MAKRRIDFPFPRPGRGFLGVNTVDGLTDLLFAQGMLAEATNYHIIGRSGLLKREGYNQWATNAVNGSNAVQGLGMWNFDGTRYLVSHAGAKLKYTTDGSSWTDLSGALTITDGQDVLSKFAHWHDGTRGNILWTDGTANPAYWDGNAAAFVALAVTKARDLATFKNHVFAINTNDRPTAIRFSDYQDITTWPSESIFDCDRNSVGMALARHNEETLLAFYEDSVHAINFNYGSSGALASFFTNQPVDMSRGCVAKSSVVPYKGQTYFASEDGFYSIGSPGRPARYISRALEGIWSELNQSRRPYLVGFPRGEPWDEVVWLASLGSSTTHNIAFVYNPVIASIYGDDAGWTIFDSTDGLLKFNAGCIYIDSTGQQKTMLGDYNGNVHHAWGHEFDSAGYQDGGDGAITSTLKTGFLDLGYRGMKGHREIWIDLELSSDRTFTLAMDGTNTALGGTSSVAIGASADELDTTFILDESFLAGSGVSQAHIKAEGNSRWFRYELTENSESAPHTINALTMLYTRKGMRIN